MSRKYFIIILPSKYYDTSFKIFTALTTSVHDLKLIPIFVTNSEIEELGIILGDDEEPIFGNDIVKQHISTIVTRGSNEINFGIENLRGILYYSREMRLQDVPVETSSLIYTSKAILRDTEKYIFEKLS